MTPEESRLAIVKLYTDTIHALGSTGWQPIGAMSAQDCVLPDGTSGANFLASRLGPASTDPEADVATVEKLWTSQGMSTTVRRSPNKLDTTIRLIGIGGPVKVVEFDADTKRSSISGDSVCVIGDPEKIKTTQVNG